ncbi:N-acetylglucosamine-specific PTS transporter subunit IIBC [Pediococcus argentinicus]|uniref:PTS system sucrose-specific EIIBCA component n=1 Tax=Pediococcus argentinicus TaxID=480391 RepID=A0A0R2NFX1_9LACO|nr:N-acetylglucosamine-specific PTS transporter subunit IIBC [Pediococcus argentinicus]KRO24719.1 N-acetylglucosamine PTS, EIICBA [Pediococcus argentinicus]NKZ22758.1 PTS transporter subunit EIIC [Pediococcus argentinicus]GEP19806.1 PTS N-acetylglucosamine transporter subunit IIABC [Pediococcus argentinicus]
MKTYFQRMGRSLQLPVAVLPAAALLEGIGHYLPANWVIAQFLQSGGQAILSNLSILFAVGLALGMSKDKDGASALAGLVAYLIPVSVLKPDSVALLKGIKVTQVDPAFNAIAGNVFIGIVAGLVAAALYNRFHETRLPMALSFFSGKRLVPILSALTMLVITILLLLIWPPLYNALVAFGKFMVSLGAVGAGLYGFFNRLLIPTGLHQALNQVFWFNIAGINDIGKFWSNIGTKGVTGMYMAGFFPVMMFGLPAGAYAIYRNAIPERKKETASLMLAGGFASFFTGVTEPLEFSFMFVAWPLYVLHAVFTGLSLGFAAFMHWTAGFTFSAGLVDFVLSAHLPMANMPLMLLVQGLVMAVIYYFGFNFAIHKFNLMTPGREPLTDDSDQVVGVEVNDEDNKYSRQAKQIYAAIGGKDNISVIDNCTTRLRLQLKDTDLVNQSSVKNAGVAGVNVLDKTNIQIVIGTEVQFVADALSKLFNNGTELTKVKNTQNSSNEETQTENTKTVKTVVENLYSVVHGALMDISEVNDATFAQKMLGDGFAVEPTDSQVVAPVDGTIMSVFPTKHAIAIKSDEGLEILVHMGIDTVQLDGKPFKVNVSENDHIKHGDVIANMDLDKVRDAGKDTTIMVIITNMDQVISYKNESDQNIKANELAGKADVKA